VVSPKSTLTKAIRKPKVTWVEPSSYADVEYRDITSEGLLRASSFKGLSKGTGQALTTFVLHDPDHAIHPRQNDNYIVTELYPFC
jgi:hypothetical protein